MPAVHVPDPQPRRRSCHLRRIDLPAKDLLAQRSDIVEAAPFSQGQPQRAVAPAPVYVVVPADSEPPGPEPVQVGPQALRIVAVGESGTVKRPDAHAADDIEPVALLCNQVLACPHLPTAFGASSR